MKMKETANTFMTGQELKESNPIAFKNLRINLIQRSNLAKKKGLPVVENTADLYKTTMGRVFQ